MLTFIFRNYKSHLQLQGHLTSCLSTGVVGVTETQQLKANNNQEHHNTTRERNGTVSHSRCASALCHVYSAMQAHPFPTHKGKHAFVNNNYDIKVNFKFMR